MFQHIFLVVSRVSGFAFGQLSIAVMLTAVPISVSSISNLDAQTFSDVTTSAGITHSHNVDTIGVQIMTGGAAAGDVDGDGWVDLFITQGNGTDILYRNNRNGTFSDVSSTSGFTDAWRSNGAAFGDVDNDGDLDLYVTTTHESQFLLYSNNGSGFFTEQAVARGAQVVMDAPYNDTRQGQSISFGDYDRDGNLDIHTGEWRVSNSGLPTVSETAARLLRNTGAGNFVDATATANAHLGNTPSAGALAGVYAFSSSFADMNGDQYPDLVVASDFGTSRLFINNQNGTFSDVTTASGTGLDENGMGSNVADYDADGDLDWFVTSVESNGGNFLYQNQTNNGGGTTFVDITDTAGVRNGGWGWGTSFIDYDIDGDLDLVMTNGFDDPAYLTDQMRLWENEGGVFTEVATTEGILDNRQGRGLLTFDFDNDGDEDILVINNQDTPVLYRNDQATGNDWIKIDTIGDISTRDGVGTRIFIDPDSTVSGDEIYRDVVAGSNFLAQNDMTLTIGLGDLDGGLIDRIDVVWLSGITRSYFDVAPNQTFNALESVPEPANFAGIAILIGGIVLRRRKRSLKNQMTV